MKLKLALVLALSSATATHALLAQDDGGKPDAGAKPDAPPKPDGDKPDAPKPEAPKPEEPPAPDNTPGPVDTDSVEAKSLAKKLHVTPNWRPKNNSVDLTYSFQEEPEVLDWKFLGADKAAIQAPGPREPGGFKGLEIGVSSSGAALALLEPIELNGDFTIEWQLKVIHMGVSSDLVFVVGAKSGDGMGVRYGDQFVKLKKGKVSTLVKTEASMDKFTEQKLVHVKIQRTGDELATWINKVERPTHKFAKKELDGKVGLYAASNMRLKIQRFHVEGAIKKA